MDTSKLDENRKKEIARLAETFAAREGYRPHETRIRDFVTQKLGAKIEVVDSEEVNRLQTGSIEILGPRQMRILLSPYSSIHRDNYTIAHEVGHYVMHAEEGKQPGKWGRCGDDLVEAEAEWFAACFLMPESTFRAAVGKYGKDQSVLAGIFRVSRPAIWRRLKELNLL